jgi:pimeloyl-ACP methyl ester carboxylesterase
MHGRHALAAVAAVCAGMLGAAPSAHAQVSESPCADPALRSALCGTVAVPLDHAAPAGPRITLSYARLPATERRRDAVFIGGGAAAGAMVGVGVGAIVGAGGGGAIGTVIGGGPGASKRELAALARAGGPLAGLRRTHDLVFVDRRGTGDSSPLSCSAAPGGRFPAGLSSAELRAAAARCGDELGDARRHYSTQADALDLEELRKALALDRVSLLAIGDGTRVAAEYARRLPDRVEAVVLGALWPVEFQDTMIRAPHAGVQGVYAEVCFPPATRQRCRVGDPAALIAEASDRLRRRPLGGVTAAGLHALVLSSDLDPLLRLELPATLRAAIGRDAAPLRRLARHAASRLRPAVANDVRFLATACMEGNQPWDPASDRAGREALLRGHLAQAAADYAPFPLDVVARRLPATLCLGWPATPRPPQPPALPAGFAAPVLVLAGREELHPPLATQRGEAATFPGASVLAIPYAGHPALTSDASGCAADAAQILLATGGRAAACAFGERALEPAPRFFRRLRDVPRARGRLPAAIERTATAVDLTLRDAERWSTAGARVRGLRGGRLLAGRRAMRLLRYELVSGVRVSGTLTRRGGRVRVTGRGAAGRLTVRRSGRMTGVLDGRRVRYRPPAAVTG